MPQMDGVHAASAMDQAARSSFQALTPPQGLLGTSPSHIFLPRGFASSNAFTRKPLVPDVMLSNWRSTRIRGMPTGRGAMPLMVK